MRKFIDLFGQEAARQATKAATDSLWEQGNGTNAYNLTGKIFVGCGVGWILISLIPIACKTPLDECIWLWIVALIQIVPGIILVILSKKSKKFQEWADKDFKKGLNKSEKLEEKVTVGKWTLPMTHGDVLTLKFLGIIAIILMMILGIGSLQGWVVW